MFCRHPRLSTLSQGLFDGLASFRDLEVRIAPVPEELQRGDAFEVFVGPTSNHIRSSRSKTYG